ncbi:MAG: hypothetical protein EOM23_06230 [Candidatus Moranbacteria bacterium]|nr:hypothetical protein [Candidatus Moranbacteria bacterium]
MLSFRGAGIVLNTFSCDEMKASVEAIIQLSSIPDVRERCLETTRRYFSLDIAIDAYSNVYRGVG